MVQRIQRIFCLRATVIVCSFKRFSVFFVIFCVRIKNKGKSETNTKVFFPSSVKLGISRHRWYWMITGMTLYAKYPKHQYIQVKLALRLSKAKSIASCQKRSGEVHLTNFRVMTVKMTSSREKLTAVQFMSKLLEKTSSAKVWCCLESLVDACWLFKMVPQLAI